MALYVSRTRKGERAYRDTSSIPPFQIKIQKYRLKIKRKTSIRKI